MQPDAENKTPEIDVHQLADRIAAGTVRLVDVREDVEYRARRVPGAQSLPLSQLADRFAELPRDGDYAVICEKGLRSYKAASFLIEQGYTNVVSVAGGTSAWVESGRPVERDPA